MLHTVVASSGVELLTCSCCGEAFEDLSKHVRAHGLTADAYRALWGLNSTTSLVNARLKAVKAELGSQYGHRLNGDEMNRPTAEQRSRWAKNREARAQTRLRRGLLPRPPANSLPMAATAGPIVARLAPKEGSR